MALGYAAGAALVGFLAAQEDGIWHGLAAAGIVGAALWVVGGQLGELLWGANLGGWHSSLLGSVLLVGFATVGMVLGNIWSRWAGRDV